MASLIVAIRKRLLRAPTDPNARAWRTYDDSRSEFRVDRRWREDLHKWETRTIWFDAAREQQRHDEGRSCMSDLSI